MPPGVPPQAATRESSLSKSVGECGIGRPRTRCSKQAQQDDSKGPPSRKQDDRHTRQSGPLAWRRTAHAPAGNSQKAISKLGAPHARKCGRQLVQDAGLVRGHMLPSPTPSHATDYESGAPQSVPTTSQHRAPNYNTTTQRRGSMLMPHAAQRRKQRRAAAHDASTVGWYTSCAPALPLMRWHATPCTRVVVQGHLPGTTAAETTAAVSQKKLRWHCLLRALPCPVLSCPDADSSHLLGARHELLHHQRCL